MDTLVLAKQIALSLLARRKKWVVLATLVALGALLPAAYYLSVEPPRYRTSALIVIESRPDRTPIYQEFAPDRPVAIQLAILRSRSLAESVIEALPRASVEDLIENPYSRDYALELQNWIRRLRGEEPVVESPQRRALTELQRSRVRFTPQPSGIVDVRAEASKPRVAVDIANTYIEVLLSRTRSFNVEDTRSTRDFLEQHYAQVDQALEQSEEALRRFNLARGGVRVPEQNAATVARLSELEGKLAEVQSNRKLTETRLATMRAKLAELPAPARLPEPTPAAAQAAPPAPSRRAQMLRGKLAALENQLLEYEIRYTDEHPRVTLTRQQIADVKRDIGDVVKDTPPVVAAAVAPAVPAPERAAFADMVAALETASLSLDAREEALRSQVAGLKGRLSSLSREEVEYTRLVSEVQSSRRLRGILAERLQGVRIREQGEMKVVKVIDPPGLAAPAGNQKRFRFMLVAMALSLAAGVGLPGVIEFFTRPVETEDDVRQLTGLPVLAVVPHVRSSHPMLTTTNGRRGSQEEHFLFAEAFRRLRVEVQLIGREIPLRRILIASSVPGEGKSTVVINLGLAFGEVGKRVIIADADLQRPTLHRTLKTPNAKGFTDLLAGTGDLAEAMNPVADKVWLAPRGGSPTALTTGGLGSERLPEVLDRMAAEAEYVILDSSPILLVPDNLYTATATDGVVLVVQSGVTRPRDLLRTKEILEKSGTPIVGIVLNRMPVRQLTRYYDYYRRYRSYGTVETKS